MSVVHNISMLRHCQVSSKLILMRGLIVLALTSFASCFRNGDIKSFGTNKLFLTKVICSNSRIFSCNRNEGKNPRASWICYLQTSVKRTSKVTYLSMKSTAQTLFATSTEVDPYQHQGQQVGMNRRQSLNVLSASFVALTTPAVFLSSPGMSQAASIVVPGSNNNNNNLSDLPPEAVRSYLQYRFQLQTAADFYVFELQDKLTDVSTWGEIGELFSGNPSRIEREFVNLFRIIGLSMPPDEADAMRSAQYDFERALANVSKATAGIRRDLPVEIDPTLIPKAVQGWDDGRIALNEFFTLLNGATGLDELKTIPPSGPSQLAQYGRSQRRYVDLKKKIKLCQNRGGPALSQAWGTLMVSGYLQDSCGIPDLESYFYQT